MSQENVEFLEGLFAGAADMDKQALLDALPDDPADVRSGYRVGRGPSAARTGESTGPRRRPASPRAVA